MSRRLNVLPRALLTSALVGALAFVGLATVSPPAQAQIQFVLSANIAPPPLRYYQQPIMPGYGYVWTPGYWAYDESGNYVWVDGTWVLPPYSGALWTPGYWAWSNGGFFFNRGYWGRTVGYYGGINYGYGYGGNGYDGGYWRGGRIYYNQSVNNFGGRRYNEVYNRPVPRYDRSNRPSYSRNDRDRHDHGRNDQQRNGTRPMPVITNPTPNRPMDWQRNAQGQRPTQNRGAQQPTQRPAFTGETHAVQSRPETPRVQEYQRPASMNRPQERPAMQPQRQEYRPQERPAMQQPQQARPESRATSQGRPASAEHGDRKRSNDDHQHR